MSTSAVAQKTDGDPVQSEESLVCEDFADREEAQDKFDSDPGAPDLAALDPDGDGEVCEEEFGDSPDGTTSGSVQPGGSTTGAPRTDHAHPSAYSRSSALATSPAQPAASAQPGRR
jgi:hypothetical protein